MINYEQLKLIIKSRVLKLIYEQRVKDINYMMDLLPPGGFTIKKPNMNNNQMMQFNRDENSTLGIVVIGFKNWLDNAKFSHDMSNVPMHIKYRMYIDQLNARNKFDDGEIINWLSKAVRFDLGVCPIYARPVVIERGLYANPDMWFLKMEYTKGWFLGKDAEWYYEEKLNQAASPDFAFKFLTNILFDTPQQVYNFWKANIKEAKQLYV